MSIRGSNFENQHPFASDHALVWAHCMPDGLLYGVDMSFTPTLFTLGTGFMLVAGRMFEITTAENISISPGNGYARVYVAIDTGGTASENSFDQVSFGVDYAANLDSFPELTQGEININQGAAVYQTEVAVLAINNTGVTTIERQMELVEAGAGGGSGSAFAAIAVSYPPGSICTCTDGIKTFTAKDTSGQALFIIPYAATWTVTATDGTNTKSQSVEITTEGQSVSVELSYELVLFDGSDNSEITGGWTAVLGVGGVTYDSIVENGQMVFVAGVGSSTGLRTVNKIDCSSYTRYCTMVTEIGVDVDGRSRAVGWTTSTPGSMNEVDFYVGFTGTGVFSCDISTIDSAYFGLFTNNNGSFTASKVWLE